ncbi:hard surface induced protein 3 [Diaporthe helianthi]|uniref:Hard surface induced protein 3 n=1 Tax=Diaporthe helianthi TaxID=158607 RepID=A0A2P5HV02_DIAHE|nr:hard surface induced protein 3 [Diaporthe helianthi]
MLPSFIRRRNDSDDTTGRHAYAPLQDVEEIKEFNPLFELVEEGSASQTEEQPFLDGTQRLEGLKRVLNSLAFLAPSFLGPKNKDSKTLRSTAWLDGLRGIAALCVVFVHAGLVWFSWDIQSAWTPDPARRWWLYQLPIFRLVVSGLAPVCVFFVVSGYTISHRFLTLARRGEFEKASSAIASSIFRRHTRLFLPAAMVSFVTAMMTYLNCFPDQGLPGVAVPTRLPPRFDSLWGQLRHYIYAEMFTTDPIGQPHLQGDTVGRPDPPYDPHLWTLPIEFTSSMVVFMFLTAFTRVHSKVRMVFALGLALYLQWFFVYWGMFLFLGGMFLCDLHFELDDGLWGRARPPSEPQNQDVPPMEGFVPRHPKRNTTAYCVLGRALGFVSFIISLWLLSMPEDLEAAAQAPGYVTLTTWIPTRFQEALVIPVGAVLTVLVVDHATFLQILFTNRFSQYMGKISFSLYMVHGPLLYSLGLILARWTVGLVGGGENDTSYVLGIFLAFVLWAPAAVYVSDLTTTFVDNKAIEFSKWAYGALLRKE